MVLFSLSGHNNSRRNGQIMKTSGQLCENIRTKWTGFFRRPTGLIHRQIKPVCLRIELTRQPIKPYHLGLIFVSYFSFSQMFAFCQQKEFYYQNQREKLLILRSYVDLLNYPFKLFWKLRAIRVKRFEDWIQFLDLKQFQV